MKKSFLLIFAVSFCVFCLFSCSEAGYKNDVSVSVLTERISSALPLPSGYSEHGKDYVSFRFEGIDEHIDDSSVIYSTDTRRADVIAVFHAKSPADAQKVASICEDFLEDQRALFSVIVEQYLPSESEKLEGASVRTFGNYIIACVLSPSDAEKAFSLSNELLSVSHFSNP